MGKFEQHAIDHAPFNPHIWFRYLDDIFMTWAEGQDNLKTFLNYINSTHPSIKFTHEYSNSPNQTLPFLDVQVHLNNNQIQTDLHTKPTDKHQYYSRHLVTPPTPNVPSLSASPSVYVVSVRPTISSINAVVNSLTQFLELRGYSRRFLKKEINRVRPIPRNETLKPRPRNNNSDRTPFAIAFNPALLSNVASALRKNLNIPQASARCKEIFQSAPIVSYKRSPNLHDLLVRSQLRDYKVKPPPGSDIHKCHHPRCLTCPFLQDGQTKYTFSATKEERNIPGTLNCKSRNLIYLIRCTKCKKKKTVHLGVPC